MKIICSAPAKVILSGEHAVVFGKPALVAAIDLRLTFSLWPEQTKINDQNVLFVAKTVKDYLTRQKITYIDKPFNFEIKSDIPLGRGLGSSAAFAVAGTAAFLKFYTGKEFEKDKINSLAYLIEKRFHSNPSGVDNSTVCFGGLIFYRKEFEFLKNISILNNKIPKNIEENLFLIDSGAPEEKTAEMVNLVGKLYNKQTAKVEKTFLEIEKTTKRIVVSIIKEDPIFFKDSLSTNEKYLETLEVVSKKTKQLLDDLSMFGLGKITGAGGKKVGSGYILFFANKKRELIDFLIKSKINFYKFRQDFNGLMYES